MWKDKIKALFNFILWDWLTTAGTRLIANESDWAILVGATTTLFWIYGTEIMVNKPHTKPWIIGGTVIGMWLGLRWP